MITGCGDVNIGYINEEKLMDTPQIKNIREDSEKKFKEIEEQLSKDIESKKDAPDEDKQKIQSEAQRKMMGIQQAYITQMKQKIDAAINSAIKDKNIDAVFSQTEDSKIVHHGGTDITDEVVKNLQ